MDDAIPFPHRTPPQKSRSFIAAAIFILAVLSGAIIGYNILKLNLWLQNRLDNTLDMAQKILPPAIWQFNYDYLNNFLEALFMDERIIFAAILTDDETLVYRSRFSDPKAGFDYFTNRPDRFATGKADITHKDRQIGCVQLALSRKGIYKNLIFNTAVAISLMGALIMIITHYYARLRASERAYRSLYENAIEGIFQSLPQGRFSSVNPAMARMFGYSGPQEMIQEVTNIGRDLYVRDEDHLTIMQLLEKNDHVYEFETQARRRDQSTFWLSISFRAIRDDRGAIQYFDGMAMDISERKEKEKALDQRRAAEATARTKSEFLANMSHEIRTPMNAVIGLTELALKTNAADRRTDYLKKIQTASRNLMGIIDDILDFSKIEAGKLNIETTPFCLDATLQNLKDIFAEKISTKSLTFSIEVSPDTPRQLLGDPLRLGQVLINLVGNAVKFTCQGSIAVWVAPERLGSETVCLRFVVQDTGVGIPQDRLAQLFDPFTQADSSTTRQYGGTGLGLTISKRLVEMMDGTIHAENIHEGGARFSFTAVFGLDRKMGQKVGTGSGGALAAGPSLSFKNARILLVEDNAINQEVAIAVLENAGIRVAVVQDGLEAVKVLTSDSSRKRRPFDAVLMDLQMPVMDGFEATRKIRDYERTFFVPRIPIIAMTAHAMQKDRDKSLEAGMDDYMIKPIQADKLYEALQRWIPSISH